MHLEHCGRCAPQTIEPARANKSAALSGIVHGRTAAPRIPEKGPT